MHLSRIIKLFIAVLFSVSCSCSSAAGNAQIRAEDNIQWSDLIEPEALDNETGEITSVEQIDALAEKISSARVNSALSGKEIILTGFVVPIDYVDANNLKTFLLVPYIGACIHVPPPPENQIILVNLEKPLPLNTMDQVQVKGIINIEKGDASPEQSIYSVSSGYTMNNAVILSDNIRHGVIRPLIILFLASMVLSLGIILPLYRIKISIRPVSLVHGIAGGIMLTIGITALAISYSTAALASFAAGFILIHCMNSIFTPSCSCGTECAEQNGKFTILAVVMHNIPEYFLILVTLIQSMHIGLLLIVSLVMHNLPLSFSIGLSLRDISWLRKIKCIFFLSILPVLLALTFYLCLDVKINSENYGCVISAIGGVISYVAVFHLIGRYIMYGSRKYTLSGTLLGIIISLTGALLFRF